MTKRKQWLYRAGLIAVLFVLSKCAMPGQESPSNAPAATEAMVVAEAQPSPTRRPQATARPVSLVETIDEALGPSNRRQGRKFTDLDVRADEGSISVTWAIDDNFGSPRHGRSASRPKWPARGA